MVRTKPEFTNFNPFDLELGGLVRPGTAELIFFEQLVETGLVNGRSLS